MGLRAYIYRRATYRGTEALAGCEEVTIVNASGPFSPEPLAPAVMIVPGYGGKPDVHVVLAEANTEALAVRCEDCNVTVEAHDADDHTHSAMRTGYRDPMPASCYSPRPGRPVFGGAYISTSDSRFADAVAEISGRRFYGAIPLHDCYQS